MLTVTSCAVPKYRCDPLTNSDCGNAQRIWQEAIDLIVYENFPNEFGKYQAVIWQDLFDNAWVTKGREINITQKFLLKLNMRQILCVAAHELAHLKMGHYYAKMGIILIPQGNSVPIGHYGSNDQINVPEGFGKNQEEEADRLALAYIRRLGFDRWDYIGLLNLLITGKGNIRSKTLERIRFILTLPKS